MLNRLNTISDGVAFADKGGHPMLVNDKYLAILLERARVSRWRVAQDPEGVHGR